MARAKSFNLFVYGTLMSPSIFRAVTGLRLVMLASDADGRESFQAIDATLSGYTKVSPDHTYLYALPSPRGSIDGYVIGPLPGACLKRLLKYEGRNYSRKKVTVATGEGPREAIAFVANLRQLAHSFGYAFRDPFKQEILLRGKIEAALIAAEKERLDTASEVTRRAVAELRGATIRDLVRRHFEAGGIGDYAIRTALSESPLPDVRRIADDPMAALVAPNYLAMVMRQVMFNQVEEQIQKDFHYELDELRLGTHYYERTVSSLAALRVLNINRLAMAAQVQLAVENLQFPGDPLIAYVRRAIELADALYVPAAAKAELDFIRDHMSRGRIPLGAELEFSNIGHEVITDPQALHVRDEKFDGFLYFPDFALDVLTWKLGGHIDDHHEKGSHRPRRGFFEIALGSLSIEANLSKPITDDPWLLNQLIHAAAAFFDIAPHSVHISLQLPIQHRPKRDRLLSLGDLKCLFALAGDPRRGPDGHVRIQRLMTQEIVHWEPPRRGQPEPTPHLLFSEISKRRSSEASELSSLMNRDRQATTGLYVQQFKFLRLSPELDYEIIATALKGLQLSCSPGSFLTPAQYQASPPHRQRFEELMAWGRLATPISEEERSDFIAHVEEGLGRERKGKAVHRKAYIRGCLTRLEEAIVAFNAWVRTSE